jgi:exosortase/archaeosortase family protein
MDTPHPIRDPAEGESLNVRGHTGTLRFVATFLLVLLSLYGLSRTPFFVSGLSPASLSANAVVAAAILNLLGEEAVATGNAIDGRRLVLTLWNACDALEPIGLYVAAVAASPVGASLKVLGFAGGSLLILAVNQLRIVSLYLAGVHVPGMFEVLHLEVWQALFIGLSVSTWLLWASWAIRRSAPRP